MDGHPLDYPAAGQIEIASPTWQAVKQFAEDGLKNSRITLETPGILEVLTESSRAEIALYKRLLALPEGKPDLNLGGNTDYNES